MAQGDYRTLRAGVEHSFEFVDMKSRFIAQLVHVDGEAAAEEFLAEVRSRHHDARHNVPAWSLSDGRERCSDDGEPQRTSGMPTLEVLRGAALADVCCVVTRYFGGTLLGPGGLVRAYTAAAQGAVAAAEAAGDIVLMTSVTPVSVRVPYALYDRVARLIADSGGKVRDTAFAEDVLIECSYLSGAEKGLVEAVRELACGEDLCQVGEASFSEF